MRRRLERFIPLVILVITVQLLAPIAAFRVVAYAVSDPLYLASICSDTKSSADPSAPAKAPHTHGDCCAFCTSNPGGGLGAEPPTPAFVALQLEFQKLSWLEAADPQAVLRTGSNAQARAPPAIS